ncbi:MAG TPA: hypothetical protein EYP49_01500 [Anaerolineae bacterium]|nr:hypothetical protein [Anaerolineae bacterium]
MAREKEIPKLARITLTTLTPLHIGSGLSLVWDEAEWQDRQQVLVMALPDGRQQPYIPASTLRGMLRAMYAFTQERPSASNPKRAMADAERAADRLFGSTDAAGLIVLSDLWPTTNEDTTLLENITLQRDEEASQGLKLGRSPKSFPVQVVPANVVFVGEIGYVENTLRDLLEAIFHHQAQFTRLLRNSKRGSNPEIKIAQRRSGSSYINAQLFQRAGDQYTITWKLGRYAKSYAKALSHYRHLPVDRRSPKSPPRPA